MCGRKYPPIYGVQSTVYCKSATRGDDGVSGAHSLAVPLPNDGHSTNRSTPAPRLLESLVHSLATMVLANEKPGWNYASFFCGVSWFAKRIWYIVLREKPVRLVSCRLFQAYFADLVSHRTSHRLFGLMAFLARADMICQIIHKLFFPSKERRYTITKAQDIL